MAQVLSRSQLADGTGGAGQISPAGAETLNLRQTSRASKGYSGLDAAPINV